MTGYFVLRNSITLKVGISHIDQRKIMTPMVDLMNCSAVTDGLPYHFSILTTQKLIKAAEILSIPIYVTTQNRNRLGETCSELQIANAVEHVDK